IAADLRRDRADRRPLRGVLAPMLEHHPYGSRAHLWRIPRLPAHRSILSRSGASGKPGTVQELLKRAGFGDLVTLIHEGRGIGAKPDDVLDACVAAWTAERKTIGRARRVPQAPPVDTRGLRMEIWF